MVKARNRDSSLMKIEYVLVETQQPASVANFWS